MAEDDRYLVLATDGVWTFLESDDVCTLDDADSMKSKLFGRGEKGHHPVCVGFSLLHAYLNGWFVTGGCGWLVMCGPERRVVSDRLYVRAPRALINACEVEHRRKSKHEHVVGMLTFEFARFDHRPDPREARSSLLSRTQKSQHES